MGKQLAKFEAEYKQAKAKAAALTADAAAGHSQRVRLAGANTSEGEANLKSALTKARKAGVTGDSFADFAKNADFKEAVKLLNMAAGQLDGEIQAIDGFCAKVQASVEALEGIAARIDKDLVKRKDSSETKKDIEALLGTIDAELKKLRPLAKIGKDKVTPYLRAYSGNFQKTVDKLLKAAPEAMRSEVEGNELPHKLTDRVLNTSLQRCTAGARDVKALGEQALDKAAKGDTGGAQAAVKQAAALRQQVKAIADEYRKIATDYKAAVENSKDKKKVLDALAKMAEADALAERTVRGIATTLKKAG